MAIFTVQTTTPTDNGSHIWFPFEHDAETVEQLREAIVEEGSALGTRLKTRRRGGMMVLEDRRPCAIFEAGIATISEFRSAIFDDRGREIFAGGGEGD